ncbi:hypothetical protein AWB80_08282 [Caballeronia pedi]|uniref:DUF2971 domain-containing protein n=1 Tax=Caballeronia pedi TaxID=1777141 RepID=A0A158E5G8_9BURK|nr:DUF2971 domain-containing protein [Caballeronia pedi]SAL02131.1 hypothetical protein AWB80_08282 [Caballeronia pedi]
MHAVGCTPRQTVYRILRFEHLVRLFKERQYTLLSPFTWEDPFEKLWSRLVFKDQPAHSDLLSRVFGSCLTFEARSDAMWSIYSRNWLGVRVTIGVGELQCQVEAAPELRDARMWFGEMNYRRDLELERCATQLIDDVARPGADHDAAVAMAWLNKRIAFRHEQEMRILAVLPQRPSANVNSKTFKFSIDPHSLVRSIHIDPRAPREVFETLKRDIRADLQFNGSVQQSSLLRLPRKLQQLLPPEAAD